MMFHCFLLGSILLNGMWLNSMLLISFIILQLNSYEDATELFRSINFFMRDIFQLLICESFYLSFLEVFLATTEKDL